MICTRVSASAFSDRRRVAQSKSGSTVSPPVCRMMCAPPVNMIYIPSVSAVQPQQTSVLVSGPTSPHRPLGLPVNRISTLQDYTFPHCVTVNFESGVSSDLPRQDARPSRTKFTRSFSSSSGLPHQDASPLRTKFSRNCSSGHSRFPPPGVGGRRSDSELYSSCSGNNAHTESLSSQVEQGRPVLFTEDQNQSLSTADDALSALSLTSLDFVPGSVADGKDSLQFREHSLLRAFRSIGEKNSEGYSSAPRVVHSGQEEKPH